MAAPTVFARTAIEIPSSGICLHGFLHLPTTPGPCPLAILVHGFGGLKEWTLPDLATSLSAAGIAALYFDPRNFGDSEGQPREEVDHLGRLTDLQNAIAYATTSPEIDAERIGLWGTSLGGRDVLAIAAVDRRVKAVVAQTPVVHWVELSGARMAGYGVDLEKFRKELAEDRKLRLLGGKATYVPFAREWDKPKHEMLETLSEEEKRNYTGMVTLQSYAPTVLADITPLIKQLGPTPVRFILAKEDPVPGQRDAFEAAQEPKSLVEVEGHHFSVYTTSKGPAIAAAVEWFADQLTPQSRFSIPAVYGQPTVVNLSLHQVPVKSESRDVRIACTKRSVIGTLRSSAWVHITQVHQNPMGPEASLQSPEESKVRRARNLPCQNQPPADNGRRRWLKHPYNTTHQQLHVHPQ
ncbi:uncharacterized protein LTR77_005130 [Saxophila tyrrhenica]|uniref:AB hydrolase-1 domain-containing protein n=1 Tax=Saxophila tyrrhenica TaxID=1690608 RepID=A0AAV9PEH4_9PEZI|nr:hypothetical protein LTR77_005130 [Saxophila tyrrhenica]